MQKTAQMKRAIAEAKRFIYVVIRDSETESKTGERFKLVKFPLISNTKRSYFCYDPISDRFRTIRNDNIFNKISEDDKKIIIAKDLLYCVASSYKFSTKKAATDFMIKYSNDVNLENVKKEGIKLINKEIIDEAVEFIVDRMVITYRVANDDFNINEFMAAIRHEFVKKLAEFTKASEKSDAKQN